MKFYSFRIVLDNYEIVNDRPTVDPFVDNHVRNGREGQELA